MKKTASSITALLIAFCVLIGQGGVVLAMDSATAPAQCEKCPCKSQQPTCCVEQSNATEGPDAPSVPPSESRVLQPVCLSLIQVGVVDFLAANQSGYPRQHVETPAFSGVPLFLRHRAILI